MLKLNVSFSPDENKVYVTNNTPLDVYCYIYFIVDGNTLDKFIVNIKGTTDRLTDETYMWFHHPNMYKGITLTVQINKSLINVCKNDPFDEEDWGDGELLYYNIWEN